MSPAECFCGRFGYRHDVLGNAIHEAEHVKRSLPCGFEVCGRCLDRNGYLELWTHAHPEGVLT
jgi:hypothetical protein